MPAVWLFGSVTSLSRASPYGVDSGRVIVSGITGAKGELRDVGSQIGQLIKSLARSHVMSDPTEKWAGAGEDPKGSLVSNTPISFPSSVGQMAMHFDAIFGVVWKRR